MFTFMGPRSDFCECIIFPHPFELYFFREFSPSLFMPSSLFPFESAFLSFVLDAVSDVGGPGSVGQGP